MNLTIETSNIDESFDRIAKDLLTRFALFVNDNQLRFTEIELYYYNGSHKDNYTHSHKRNASEWRFHNQGLDITLQGDDESDGGILIRGILLDHRYINGPRNVVRAIFECFNKVTDKNQIVLKQVDEKPVKILKTFRHLPNINIDPNFHNKYYRYLVDIDSIDIPLSMKILIKKNSQFI